MSSIQVWTQVYKRTRNSAYVSTLRVVRQHCNERLSYIESASIRQRHSMGWTYEYENMNMYTRCTHPNTHALLWKNSKTRESVKRVHFRLYAFHLLSYGTILILLHVLCALEPYIYIPMGVSLGIYLCYDWKCRNRWVKVRNKISMIKMHRTEVCVWFEWQVVMHFSNYVFFYRCLILFREEKAFCEPSTS